MNEERTLAKVWVVAVWLGVSVSGQAAGSEHPATRAAPDAVVSFILDDVEVAGGQLAEMPLTVRTNTALSMVAWSVEFDPGFVEFVRPRISDEFRKMLAVRPVEEHLFEWHADNEDGWAQALLVADFNGRERFSLPPGLLRSLFVLEFRVRADAVAGTYPLTFSQPGDADYAGNFRRGESAVYNGARPHGTPVSIEERFEDTTDPELVDGTFRLPIIGDVGIFVHGDANIDLAVDIADPISVLGHLFLSDAPLPCPEAADVNEDGVLDLTDPVIVLDFLFIGRTSWVPSSVEITDEHDPGCSYGL